MIALSSERLKLLPFLPSTYLKSMVGLDCLGLSFQVIGTAVLAGNTTLSTSQSGAGLAVAGLVIQSLTLVLGISVCVVCIFWAWGHVRILPLTSLWTATKEEELEDVELWSPSPSKRFRWFIVGMSVHAILIMWRKTNSVV